MENRERRKNDTQCDMGARKAVRRDLGKKGERMSFSTRFGHGTGKYGRLVREKWQCPGHSKKKEWTKRKG